MNDISKAIIILYLERSGYHDAIAAFITHTGIVMWKDLRNVGESANLVWHPGLGPRNIFADERVKVIRIYEQLPVVTTVDGTNYRFIPVPETVVKDAKIQFDKTQARLKAEDDDA